jgi:RNA polymerase sigma-70 factor (ECF subfamily)
LIQGKEFVTDSQVIREVLDGNDSAFRMLVQRYESQVASTVIGMLGNCPEADDVGQETFIRFYNALTNFRGDSQVSTYLTRIAINLSLNELKRRKRRFGLFINQDENSPEIADDSDQAEKDTQKELIHKALEKLDLDFRTVTVLRLIDGYSTAETAKILQLPQGTVLSRLSRAQKKLKDILTAM